MPSIVVAAHLIAADKHARQKVTNALQSVSEYSRTHEPGVVRYAICHPRDVGDQTSVFVFEQYLTQAAFDAHMASKPVQEEAIAYFGANPHLFGAAPTISTTLTSAACSRPEINKAREPVIAFGSFKYAEGSRAGALKSWERIVDNVKRERDVLSFGVYADKDDRTSIKTLEVYENETTFREVRSKRKGAGETGEEVFLLKLMAGYLEKEGMRPNL